MTSVSAQIGESSISAQANPEDCNSRACLETLYGPNAIKKIAHMFRISGLEPPPHLEVDLSGELEAAGPLEDPELTDLASWKILNPLTPRILQLLKTF